MLPCGLAKSHLGRHFFHTGLDIAAGWVSSAGVAGALKAC